MQDFKRLSQKKRSPLSSLFASRNPSPRNTYKSLIEPPQKKKRLRLLLPLIASLLVAYPVFSLLFSSRPAVSSVREEPRPGMLAPGSLDPFSSFQLASSVMGSARFTDGHLEAPLPDGGTVVYAIDEAVQQRVQDVFSQFRVPYGVFVAIEPKTGKVLAMAAHSAVAPEWEQRAFYSVYPMASLFKIITATAALDQKKVTPETVIPFRGGLYSESSRYWSSLPRRGAQEMDLTTAMSKSVNPVFGRLACDIAGRESVLRCAERFGFNHLLLPGTPVEPSKAEYPRTDDDLRLMGAGLGREVKISPVHAAVMMAAIANGGTMLAPALVDEIRDSKGGVTFSSRPKVLRNIVSPEVAAQLTKMMSATVSKGTSRRAFHDRRGRPKLADITVAAKTGSINGTDPQGHYNWFAAFAPVDEPQIALVALVINQDKWKIKASYVGEQALEAFFK